MIEGQGRRMPFRHGYCTGCARPPFLSPCRRPRPFARNTNTPEVVQYCLKLIRRPAGSEPPRTPKGDPVNDRAPATLIPPPPKFPACLLASAFNVVLVAPCRTTSPATRKKDTDLEIPQSQKLATADRSAIQSVHVGTYSSVASGNRLCIMVMSVDL